ncbi:OB-fold domain-containing protein [Frankia sp. CNm7]|uniref:OB-fold domain-containing protein n=1 Tax=Frankia nepalensis TaxID=1836974 RepID=A0A937RBD9_9ACTN|nr:OB-fold domain-containing protein [Frankia nepalensis]MBL7500000.1 OB-fold domain-containing protein [Frankia nepalensis]MBL7510654.1 OB-fold domain-containing protein [Frankia nepalensis]MBL7520765.1 OB-fold domain-containing protein [Frankia nepalensis]MBL7627187.1 OB-fold domain-containing protein [Frankia nepalensis]
MTSDASPPPARPLPAVDDLNGFFWTAGRDGVLRIQRCDDCAALVHPPQPVCCYCHSERLGVAEVSGLGTVVGATVNHQPWEPAFPPPFVVASVALDEDPRVRLITSLVDVPLDEAAVGRRVRVRFEPAGDVWLPVFAPVRDDDGGETFVDLPDDPIAPAEHARHVRPMVRADKFEDRVALTGIGMSPVGRRLMLPPITLAVAAARAAVADAGLELSDIDGLSTFPGGELIGGFTEGGVTAVADALGIRPTWYNGGSETFGPGGAVVAAMLAVASGLARHVLCFRTVWQATYAAQQRAANPTGGSPYGIGGRGGRVPGPQGYVAPYGVGSVALNLAMIASNYFHRYGATREALGWIALNQRANAALNPDAVYREPMTMDDYLGARMITTPFGLYDCDVPMDASLAVIVSAVETAHDLAKPPVLVEAVGTQITERFLWHQSTTSHEPQTLGPSAHLWSRTSLRPADVQVAELYDGFTFNCLSWLEALGFCGIGEAADFVAGGHNIALKGGVVALNTHGGQLSAGRTHGMGMIHEAVVQLRGEGGARQVDGCSVAAVSTGGLAPAGAILLRRS